MAKTVFFYGDSNTYGYDPRGMLGFRYPAADRWTEILTDLCEGSWIIEADGMNGREIPSSDIGFESLYASIRAGLPFDLFAVMLGTNDMILESKSNETIVTTKMERMLRTLQTMFQEEGIEAKILLIAPPDLNMDLPELYPLVKGLESGSLSASYQKLAERLGVLFTDAASFHPPLAFDGVHMSPEGHHVFARGMAQVLLKL